MYNTGERETRKFWAITERDRQIVLVDGYICDNSPGYWWVPTLGESLAVSYSIFDTKLQAVQALLRDLQDERHKINDKIENLLNIIQEETVG